MVNKMSESNKGYSSKVYSILDSHYKDDYNGKVDSNYVSDSVDMWLMNTKKLYDGIFNKRRQAHSVAYEAMLDLFQSHIKDEGERITITSAMAQQWFKRNGLDYKEVLKPVVDRVNEERSETDMVEKFEHDMITEDLDEEQEQVYRLMQEENYDDFEIVAVLHCLEMGHIDIDDVIDEEDGTLSSSLNVTSNSWGIEVNGYEFRIFDSYDDAYDAAVESVENIIDDIGFEGLNLEISEFMDDDIFKDALVESFEYYCEDIANESSRNFENRLVEECYDNGLIDDDDFEQDEDGEPDYENCLVDTDELTSRYVENYENGIYDWYREYVFNFGEEGVKSLIDNNPNAIDMDALCRYIVDSDGPESTLAGYDGNENTLDYFGTTYYIYRTN